MITSNHVNSIIGGIHNKGKKIDMSFILNFDKVYGINYFSNKKKNNGTFFCNFRLEIHTLMSKQQF